MERVGNLWPLKIAFVGTYPPRRCGVATFTGDLADAIAREFPQTTCFAVPVNDGPSGYVYSPQVRFEIEEGDVASYRHAADFLNINNVELVCLQHEYGLFGGPAGGHILALLRGLRMPVVSTLHTILCDPDPVQRQVLAELVDRSDRVVVMARRGAARLQDLYGVPERKIDIISHGIPDVPFVDPNFYEDQFGVEGRQVLLTFGLLSPNKGISYVVEAIPQILERHPNVVYIVLGATHPRVLRQEGESYRLSLERLAKARDLNRHVVFHNRFASAEDLAQFVGAADICITPYVNRAQITSGTLSYAVGVGKAVISTPYWHAEELLADGRGVLVPFRDPAAIARGVIDLLDDDAKRHAMRKRAYLHSRGTIWSHVARRYMESFEQARQARIHHPRAVFAVRTLGDRPMELPTLRLDHLRHLTDDLGILQHAVYTVPNYAEGYTTDDNTRALIVSVLLEEASGSGIPETRWLTSRYLAFLLHAFNRAAGRFRNTLSIDRRWQEEVGSEDCHARALWAVGVVVGRSSHEGLVGPAHGLFDAALLPALEFTSPRAWAFVLFGLQQYLQRFPGDRRARGAREALVQRLLDAYRQYRAPDWHWFEDVLAYANASLPYALIECGQAMEHGEAVEIGLAALEWLADLQRSPHGHFVPIGSNGFYRRGGDRARFDQQPIEAQATVSACLAAYTQTGARRWREEAERAFEWFLGRNDLGMELYDPVTGGCRDGLHPDGVNQNQGAESTLAFLHALLEMRLAEHIVRPFGGVRRDDAALVPESVGDRR